MPNVIINGSSLNNPAAGDAGPQWATDVNALVVALAANSGRDFSKAIFVNKNGNDAYDGLTPSKSKLTFASAITAATAQTKSVVCLDQASYAASVTMVAGVSIFAPLATITGNVAGANGANLVIGVITGNYSQANGTAYVEAQGIGGTAGNTAGATTYLQAGYITGAQSWAGTIYKSVLTEGTTSTPPASNVTVVSAGFAGLLSPADTDVQKALTTLDSVVGADITLDAAQFSQNLSNTDTDVQTAMETIDKFTLGGGGGGDWEWQAKAGDFFYGANPAPLDDAWPKFQLYDDTTEEFIYNQILLPADVSAFTKVHFLLSGKAIAGSTTKYVKFRVGYRVFINGTDPAFGATYLASGDLLVNGSAGFSDIFTWSANLPVTWVANANVNLSLSRVAPGGANLTGDYGVSVLKVRLSAT